MQHQWSHQQCVACAGLHGHLAATLAPTPRLRLAQHTMPMRTGHEAQTTIGLGRIVQMQPHRKQLGQQIGRRGRAPTNGVRRLAGPRGPDLGRRIPFMPIDTGGRDVP